MTKDDYKWFKEHGICVKCRKEKAHKGRTMCLDCLDQVKYESEVHRSNESKKQRADYIKRKRELCVAFGICRRCLCREVVQGKTRCEHCARKDSNSREKKREVYMASGKCLICGGDILEGFNSCAKCVEHNREIARTRKKADSSSHCWRMYSKKKTVK